MISIYYLPSSNKAFYGANSHLHTSKLPVTERIMQILRDEYMLNENVDSKDDYEDCKDEGTLQIDVSNEMTRVKYKRQSTDYTCNDVKIHEDQKNVEVVKGDVSTLQIATISPSSLKFVGNIKREVHLHEPVEIEVNNSTHCLCFIPLHSTLLPYFRADIIFP